MGKDGFLTPKAIANRIKAKGLQKLKFYCQMCQKQCRDANGFKCHKESEGHQRMMLLFAEDANKYVHDFSDEFLRGFLDLCRHRFGSKLVKANTVYQEYIKDRDHVHMNSTKWTTLSEFCKYLGREGLCHVEEREEGFFISYIDQAVADRLKKAKEMEEERVREMEIEEKRIERQMKRAQREAREREEEEEVKPAEFIRTDDDVKVAMEMRAPPPKRAGVELKLNGCTSSSAFSKLSKPLSKDQGSGGVVLSSSASSTKRKATSALDEIMKAEERRLEKEQRVDYWLVKGIAVKVMSKEVGDGQYYKRKGEVIEVIDKYVAVVRLFDVGVKLRLDQQYLETVIPQPGGTVKLLNGAYRGCTAEVKALKIEEFCVVVDITSGPRKGKRLSRVAYEDVSRLVSN